MHRLLSLLIRPGARVMDRLRYAEKFLLISVLFAAPLVTVLYLYVANAGAQVAFSAAESTGNRYLRPLSTLAGDVVRLRALGESGDANARATLQKKISADLEAVKAIEGELGTELKSGAQYADVVKDVTKLVSGQPKDEAFVAAIGSMAALVAQVGDGSNLILDPDLDSYYLMDFVIVEFPSLLQTISDIGALERGIAERSAVTPEETARLSVLAGLTRDRLGAIERGLGVSYTNTSDATLKPTLDAPSRTLLDRARALAKTAEDGMIPARGASDPSLQATEALLTMQATTIESLDGLISTRIEGFETKTRRVQIFTVIALIAVLYLLVGFYRSVTTTSRRIATAAHQLAEEDLPSLVTCLAALATGDLTQRARVAAAAIEISSRDELGRVAGDVNRVIARLSELSAAFGEMSTSLHSMVGQVQSSANGLATTSEHLGLTARHTGDAVQQVARAIQDVATGAYETNQHAVSTTATVTQLGALLQAIAEGTLAQERDVQQAAATATAMVAKVEQVAVSTQSVAAASQQTRATAARGANAVRETMVSMAEIEAVVQEAAEKVSKFRQLGDQIGAVAETIDEIAEQTNLLALNAAIEAARAGEHGVGFAVVADEVRKLAERSGRETRQIGALIEQVQEGTSEVVSAMEAGSEKVCEGTARADQAGRALDEIQRAVEETVARVGEIATLAQETADGGRAVTDAMTGISHVARESAATTEQMSSQAGRAIDAAQGISEVCEQQSAAAEQVSASAEQMTAQVEQMSAQATELSATAEHLQALVARFRLEAEAEAADAGAASTVAPRRRSDDWRRDGPRRTGRRAV